MKLQQLMQTLNPKERCLPLYRACTFILFLIMVSLETQAFAQETIIVDDNFEFFQAGTGNIGYFYQDEKVDWHPIDAVDFIQEKDPKRKKQKLFAYYDSLYESISLLSISDILKPENRGRFLVFDQNRPNFGFINRPIWYRLKVGYQGQQSTKKILINLNGFVLDSHYFVVENRDAIAATFRRSLLEPQELKSKFDTGNNTTFVLELSSQRREVEVYFMAYTSIAPHHFNIELHSEQHLEETTAGWLPFQWAYTGATVGLLIYNLGVFLVARQKVYLYYVLSVGTNLLMAAELNGFYFNIFTENAAVIWTHQFLLALGIHGIFLLAFAREFLNFASYKRLNRLTTITQRIAAIATPIYILGSAETMLPIAILMIFTIVPIAVGPAIWLMTKKDRQAYFYILAIFVFMVGSFLKALMMSGSLPSYFFLDHIMEIGSLIESLILSIAMGDQLRTLNLSLEKHIRKVEEIVEKKTREIRSIMRHINQGIFSILPGFRIHEDYSQHLCKLVGRTDILGTDPVLLLSEGSNLNDDDVARMRSAVDLSLNSPFEFELNESHLPRAMEMHGKSVEIDWLVIEDDSNQTEKLLVTIRDVTEIKKLRGQAEDHAREISRISEILAVDIENCQRFFDTSTRMLSDVDGILNSDMPFDETKLKSIFMNYHTMKGHVRSLGFKDLTNEIHKAEHLCSQYQSNPGLVNIESLKADYSQIRSILESYISISRDKLGRSASSAISFKKEEIKKLLDMFQHLSPTNRQALSHEEAALHYLYYQDLAAILKGCCDKVAKIAMELGKNEPQFIVNCADVDLLPQTVELLQNVFVHLLRNAVDHGLETPDVRVSKNKPPQGLITISGAIESENLIIMSGDDGQGLNLKRIREKALEKGIIDENCQDIHIISSAIFNSGFSTASQLSEISGRGVGLDAVRTMLEDAGGTITMVFPEPQKATPDSVSVPFLFRIELPGSTWVPGFNQRPLKVPA
ncbi:7TM diverse intracellular signaling domain-containing protein [Oligoflexus tunisiensis]|uniref:7TM diverse intracellular signaling domain-containing protein n=1 Tax=Oligoflexus tunisiensis TaxID=708132 RepID=UPI000A71AF07|nr:7TM diverse intracellular signaling domain-containing protein [Oligoflexus tunisiensis]